MLKKEVIRPGGFFGGEESLLIGGREFPDSLHSEIKCLSRPSLFSSRSS